MCLIRATVAGLQLNEINFLMPKSENIEHLMPTPRTVRRREQDPLSKTDVEIKDVADPPGGPGDL